MPTIDGQNLATVAHVTSLAQRVKNELDTLDGKNFSEASFSDGKLSFFAAAGDSTPLKTIDLTEERFLDQTKTTFVQSFAWSNATYPSSTNPNLDGKPVFVLAVKGDKTTNPTLTYSFVDMSTLVDTYLPADKSIGMAGNSISVNISATTGNLLSLAGDGLFVGHDSAKVDVVSGKQLSTEDYTTAEKTKLGGISAGAQVNVIETIKIDGTALTPDSLKAVDINLTGKVDTVAGTADNLVIFGADGAIADAGLSIAAIDARGKVDTIAGVVGNIVLFGANGAIVDSGYAIAGTSAMDTILDSIFGAASGN